MNGAITRSPARQLRTSGPVSTMVPQYSWPGTCGSATSGSAPVQACQSDRQTPQASTSTTTPSRGQAGSGRSADLERRTPGGQPGGPHQSDLHPVALDHGVGEQLLAHLGNLRLGLRPVGMIQRDLDHLALPHIVDALEPERAERMRDRLRPAGPEHPVSASP
jgi:hypothetical protein